MVHNNFSDKGERQGIKSPSIDTTTEVTGRPGMLSRVSSRLSASIYKILLILNPERLTGSPTFNLGSALVTLASILIIILPIFVPPSLSASHLYRSLDRSILFTFFIEILIRIFGERGKYIKSPHIYIDTISVLPLVFTALLPHVFGGKPPEGFEHITGMPGWTLFESVRILRTLYYIKFFYRIKQMDLSQNVFRSAIKVRFFTGVSVLLYIIILASGAFIAVIHYRLVENLKHTRVERIKRHIQTYGMTDLNEIFRDFIIRIENRSIGENYQIYNVDPGYVRSHYSYGRDFVQIDGNSPGTSVQIQFVDLNTQQKWLEFGIIFLGGLTIAGVLLSLNHYLDTLVLSPVERARRVMNIRIRGEELPQTMPDNAEETEMSDLIQDIDRFYRLLTAPADTPLPEREMFPEEQEHPPE